MVFSSSFSQRKDMKLINTLTLITWVLVMLVACVGTSGDSLNGTTWELYSIGKYSPVAGGKITIRFEDGQASGSSGCNLYGGAYQVNGNKINFRELESTLMACVDPAMMEQETTFMQFLGEAQRLEILDGQLLMYRSDGEALTFIPAR